VGGGDGALTPPRWLRWSWVAPAAFLLVFLAYPLVVLIVTVTRTSEGTLLDRLASPVIWQVTGLATVQALMSTVLALVVGLPLANVTSRYRYRGRAFAQAVVTVPFVLPTVVVALAFRSVVGVGPSQGFWIVVLAHAYVNIAVVTRIVGAQWAQHSGDYELVARTLGATRTRAFIDVTLPSLRSAIAASAAVVFVFSFTSLGIVLLLGDASTRTLESQVLRQTSVLLDFPGAAATALVQLVVVTFVLLLGAAAARRAPARRSRPVSLRPLPPSAIGRAAVLATAGVGMLIVLVPVLALVITSLRGSDGWTLTWWTSLSSIDAGTTRLAPPAAAIATSLVLATVTALLAALVGGLAALTVLTPGRPRLVALIAVVPLGVSAATLGLGMLLAFGRPPLDLRASGLLIPIAHSLVAIPLVVAVVAPGVSSTDPRLASVAATLGATPSRAFWTAYGPVLRIVMVASAALAGAVSLGEFGAAAFLGRAASPTVPVQIVRLLGRPGEQSLGVAAVLAVILVIVTLAVVLIVDRWSAPARSSVRAPATVTS
jgi:thiamine transport system permease protein